MRLPLITRLVQLTLIFGALSSLNCQRITTLPPVAQPHYPPLIRLSPHEYPYFSDNGDREALWRALNYQLSYLAGLKQPAEYSFGNTSVSSEKVRLTLETFLSILNEAQDSNLTQLIKDNFDLYQSTGENGTGSVIFTGYYLPEFEGCLTATDLYRYPLYRPPDDLRIEAPNANRTKRAFRMESGRLLPYYTREEIDQDGVLRNRGYEIAYLKDPLDCYLLHVQGSGAVMLPDGTPLAVHFAGSNYQPYRSLREEMIKDGILDPHQASMDSIRSYFAHNPGALQGYLNRNERYTFFSIVAKAFTGSLGVPLTPGRSIASDKEIFPPGALSYIMTAVPSFPPSESGKTSPWAGFVLNQDEGGAIRGPHRVDIFWGMGAEAEYVASRMKYPGKLYYLLVKDGRARP